MGRRGLWWEKEEAEDRWETEEAEDVREGEHEATPCQQS